MMILSLYIINDANKQLLFFLYTNEGNFLLKLQHAIFFNKIKCWSVSMVMKEELSIISQVIW